MAQQNGMVRMTVACTIKLREGKQDQILLVNISQYIGFWLYCRSCLLWSPVLDAVDVSYDTSRFTLRTAGSRSSSTAEAAAATAAKAGTTYVKFPSSARIWSLAYLVPGILFITDQRIFGSSDVWPLVPRAERDKLRIAGGSCAASR